MYTSPPFATHVQVALAWGQMHVASILLSAGPAAEVLSALAAAGDEAQPLFADYVVARLPLSDAEWEAVPTPCPGLGRALQAALAHSPAQAAACVAHLAHPEAAALRVAAA